MSFLEDAHELQGELAELRHDLHRQPELGLELPRTQARVLSALQGLPLEITEGKSVTSVTAVLRGTGDSRTRSAAAAVLLRGDMDALPVHERSSLPYRSEVDGVMHACGHDLHTAMLVGAARLLSHHRDQLDGDVVFMFQPGEEGWNGAQHMIDEGVLTAAGRQADAAYAMHVFSSLAQQGQFLTRPGTILAAADELHVTVIGTGGHASAPYLALDPIPVAATMVTSLQTMVTREFDIFDPVVITIGKLEAGTKANIIPDTAHFEATMRTFSEESRAKLKVVAPRLLDGIAAAFGMHVEAEYIEQYPPTITDSAETAFSIATIAELFGGERHTPMVYPLGGAEDFSRVLKEIPGSFIGLGAVPDDIDVAKASFNHSAEALFDDAVLSDGAALFAELATRRLAQR